MTSPTWNWVEFTYSIDIFDVSISRFFQLDREWEKMNTIVNFLGTDLEIPFRGIGFSIFRNFGKGTKKFDSINKLNDIELKHISNTYFLPFPQKLFLTHKKCPWRFTLLTLTVFLSLIPGGGEIFPPPPRKPYFSVQNLVFLSCGEFLH